MNYWQKRTWRWYKSSSQASASLNRDFLIRITKSFVNSDFAQTASLSGSKSFVFEKETPEKNKKKETRAFCQTKFGSVVPTRLCYLPFPLRFQGQNQSCFQKQNLEEENVSHHIHENVKIQKKKIDEGIRSGLVFLKMMTVIEKQIERETNLLRMLIFQ